MDKITKIINDDPQFKNLMEIIQDMALDNNWTLEEYSEERAKVYMLCIKNSREAMNELNNELYEKTNAR